MDQFAKFKHANISNFTVFVPLKSSIECNFNSTKIIFSKNVCTIDFGTILFLLLVIQTK